MCFWRAERQESLRWTSCPLSLSVQLWGRDEVAVGREDLVLHPYSRNTLPSGFLLSALVWPCLLPPTSKQTAVFQSSHFHSQNEPAASAGISYGKLENKGRTYKRFGETRQLRNMGAYIRPQNKLFTNCSTPKEAIKILMIPLETLHPAWPYLLTS